MFIIAQKKNGAKFNFGEKEKKNLIGPWEPWEAKRYSRFYILRKLFQQESMSIPHQGQLSWEEREANHNKLAKNIYTSFALSLRE